MSDEFRSEGTTTLDYLRVRYEWLGKIIDETEGRVATLTAERDKLLAAANRVLQWFGANDSEDAAVLDDLTAVVLQVEKRQAEQQQ